MLGKPITDHIHLSNVRPYQGGFMLLGTYNVFGSGNCNVYRLRNWVYIDDCNYVKRLCWRIHYNDWCDTDKTGM